MNKSLKIKENQRLKKKIFVYLHVKGFYSEDVFEYEPSFYCWVIWEQCEKNGFTFTRTNSNIL